MMLPLMLLAQQWQHPLSTAHGCRLLTRPTRMPASERSAHPPTWMLILFLGEGSKPSRSMIWAGQGLPRRASCM